MDSNNKEIEKLEEVNKILTGKIVKKIELDEKTTDLGLYIEDNIIVDIYANSFEYENWEINSKYGDLVGITNLRLAYFK